MEINNNNKIMLDSLIQQKLVFNFAVNFEFSITNVTANLEMAIAY